MSATPHESGQPRGRTGAEPARAYSALRTRLLLVVPGALFCAVMAGIALSVPDPEAWLVALGIGLLVLAVGGAVDAVVVRRRLQRVRAAGERR